MGKILSSRLGTQEDLDRLNLAGPSIGSVGGSYIRARNLEKLPGGIYETFKIPSRSLKKKKDSPNNNSKGESKK